MLRTSLHSSRCRFSTMWPRNMTCFKVKLLMLTSVRSQQAVHVLSFITTNFYMKRKLRLWFAHILSSIISYGQDWGWKETYPQKIFTQPDFEAFPSIRTTVTNSHTCKKFLNAQTFLLPNWVCSYSNQEPTTCSAALGILGFVFLNISEKL